MIGHLELVSYLYCNLLGELGMPIDSYVDVKLDEREHHGHHIVMPTENPRTWQIDLVRK
jgi:hypothetical protein